MPVKRSHSVCAQGGINAAKNQKGEGDTTQKHFDDTIYGGDFLANQPLVKRMCEAAPGIIDLLDRMGVMFNRTPEGLLDYRRFGGTLYHRTAFAGATTGQQLLYALDEQVRRHESEGRVSKARRLDVFVRGHRRRRRLPRHLRHGPALHGSENVPRGRGHFLHRRHRRHFWTLDQLRGVHRLGAVRSVSAGRRLRQRRIHPGPSDGHSRGRQAPLDERIGARRRRPCVGAKNPGDKRAAKSIPEAERFYFLEEWYPKYGNLVPRDIATRAIHRIVYQEKLGIQGQAAVYLDVTHIPRETLDRKLEGILEIYEKFLGVDPREEPMKVFPAMHYTMGGIWVNGEDQAHRMCRDLCRGRMRIPVSRRESPGGEFAGLVHLRRRHCWTRGGQIRAQSEKGPTPPTPASLHASRSARKRRIRR